MIAIMVLGALDGASLRGASGAHRAAAAQAQSGGPANGLKPLRRMFHAGDEARYRVRLVVHSELEGPGTVKIGSVTYVKPERHSADARLSWVATERVVSVAADGSAQIREQLDGFARPTTAQPSGQAAAGSTEGDDGEAAKLSAAVMHTLAEWARARTLEFRVEANGTSKDVAAEGAPELDESPPHLLNLWLLHALRPQATLPEHPVQPGDSWQEPRRVHIAGWTNVGAGETDEWLEGPPGDQAAVRLHVVQEISGHILEGGAKAAEREERQEERGETQKGQPAAASSKTERFFAESLSTIELNDGRVLGASRSARKEIVEVLPPVEGLPKPPRFRATLSVQVEIESCMENGCEAGGNR